MTEPTRLGWGMSQPQAVGAAAGGAPWSLPSPQYTRGPHTTSSDSEWPPVPGPTVCRSTEDREHKNVAEKKEGPHQPAWGWGAPRKPVFSQAQICDITTTSYLPLGSLRPPPRVSPSTPRQGAPITESRSKNSHLSVTAVSEFSSSPGLLYWIIPAVGGFLVRESLDLLQGCQGRE